MNEQLDQPPTEVAAKTEHAPAPRTRPARTAQSRRPTPRPQQTSVQEEEDSFFEKHRIKLIIGAVVLLGAGAFFLMPSGKTTHVTKVPERIVSISLPPPPPPPPPPPKIQPPPPPEQKMIEQAPVEKPDEKPPEAPKPPDAPAPLGTNIKGTGPGTSGLGSGSGSGNLGGAGAGNGNRGSKWGWYAGQVQSKISEALRANRRTRNASLRIEVRIWPDSTGRISRVQLAGSTGDAALDNAIRNEVLTGLQLQEPPPAGMPSPIVLRLTARRPN